MWFTNFPLGRVERARAVILVQRLYMAVMRPPLRRIPVVMLRYRHWWMQREEIIWRQNSTKTRPIPLPMPGIGESCCWFASDSEAKLTIAFECLLTRKTETIKSHLYHKWAGYLGRIRSNFEKACRPKPPFDAVIHSQYNAWFFSSCLVPPFPFLCFSVS